MVEQPDWHNEEGEDDGGNDECHEGVDAASSKVADSGIAAFGGSFLIRVRWMLDDIWGMWFPR